MELNIQKYLRAYGIDKAIDEFKLKAKYKDNLVMLKYDQIESPMSKIEVQECRGIILNNNTFDIVCLPFFKFFNYGEGNASKIDWKTARCFKKYDGSCLTLYNYNNNWYVSTTGTIDAETSVNNNPDLMFSDLFWNTLESNSGFSKDEFTSKLDVNSNYMFELCTPYNIVVTPHKTSNLILLGARNKCTLLEYNFNELENISKLVNIQFAENYNLNSFEEIIKTYENMPFSEEGYVVCDGFNNRNKLKNPAYVAAHFLKSSTAQYKIVDIIKSNEIDEYIATFPERHDEILALNTVYHYLAKVMMDTWKVLNKNNYVSKKDWALAIIDITNKTKTLNDLSGFFFSILNNKIDTSYKYLNEMDEKRLYEKLLKLLNV